MATLRDLRKRIRSVQSTQKITRAMKMVAAAKLRRAQERLLAARPYAQKIGEIATELSSRVDPAVHPLLSPPEGAHKVLTFVITSDRGLCAGFNSNIFRAFEANAVKWKGEGKEVQAATAGRKGRNHLKKRGYLIAREYIQGREITYDKAREIGDDLISEYLKGDIGEVYLIFNYFRSAMSQRTVIERLLPFSAQEERKEVEHIYEPSRDVLVDALLSRCIRYQIYRALLESFASEQGARMTAMDSATSNATEMIGNLSLIMNKARQASITKELMDIINGAEALRR